MGWEGVLILTTHGNRRIVPAGFRTALSIVPGILMALVLLAGAGCSRESAGTAHSGQSQKGGGSRGRGPTAFPVEVQPVPTRDVEYTVTAVGSIEAFEIVQVTARVPGAIERIRFREGDRVREGDVLVEIEPERYRLLVQEALADVEKAEAELAEAEAGRDRREAANRRTDGLISTEELDVWRTRARAARADVEAKRATLAIAQRNENDALVRAPFAGTIQSRDVQTGRYVQPGTLLTTLVRRDPMLLRFAVPESDAGRLAPGLVARFRVGHSDVEHEARITHVAESADPATRMVAVTGEVAPVSADQVRPGAFAEVVVPVGESSGAALAPEAAIRPSERGFLAFVIAHGVARERILTLGLRTHDGLVEVREGLAPGESLVVRGAEALQDGAKVRVVPAASGASR